MKRFLADFNYLEPFATTVKTVRDFKIEALNKREAKKQIREWFDVQGNIRMIEEE